MTLVLLGIAAFAFVLTGSLGGASGSLPFLAAAKAGTEAPAPALTAQGYYQAQDPAQYYAQYYAAQARQPQQFAVAQDPAQYYAQYY